MDAADLVDKARSKPTSTQEAASELADAQILAAVDGCRLTTIRGSHVEAHPAADAVVVRAMDPGSDAPVVAILIGDFSYPICGQPVMRVRQGVYMLPTAVPGETLCLRAESAPIDDVVALEAAISAFAVLRDRSTGELVSIGDPASPASDAHAAGHHPAPSAPQDSDGDEDAAADGVASADSAGSRSAAMANSAAEGGAASWAAFLSRAVSGTASSVSGVSSAIAAGFAAGKASASASGAGAVEASATDGAPDAVAEGAGPLPTPPGPASSDAAPAAPGGGVVATQPAAGAGPRSLLASVASKATAGVGHAWSSVLAAQSAAVLEKQRRFPKAASAAEAAAPEGTGEVQSEGAAWRWAEGALVEAGQWAAVGLVVGGRATGSGVRAAGSALTARLKPAAEGKEVKVSGKTMRQLRRARMASSSAVMVTKALTVTMTELAKGMGAAMAKMVTESKSGSKLVAKASGSATARGLRRVGLASLIAVGDIWDGLEEGLRTAGADTLETAGSVVEHRYGEDAAAAAREGLMVVGDLGTAAVNVGKAAPTRVVVSASKTAAQRVVMGDEAAKTLRAAERERARGTGTA